MFTSLRSSRLFLSTGLGVDFGSFIIPVSPYQVPLSLSVPSVPSCIEDRASNPCGDEGVFFPSLAVIFQSEGRSPGIDFLAYPWVESAFPLSIQETDRLAQSQWVRADGRGLRQAGYALLHTYLGISNCWAEFIGWCNLGLALNRLCTRFLSDLRKSLPVQLLSK